MFEALASISLSSLLDVSRCGFPRTNRSICAEMHGVSHTCMRKAVVVG